LADLPESAAWRLLDAHEGFEVLFPRRTRDGYQFEGHSVGVEEGEAWSISYTLDLDAGWTARSGHVRGHSRMDAHEVKLEADGSGGWLVNGEPATQLGGCPDIDLEGSAFTNALPVHRVGLAVGASADAPAAYVRAQDLSVERLEQRYRRISNEGERSRYDYESPAFDTRCVLVYDESGLVLDYPGIAVRVQ
jgi:uncharacterized protein